MKAAVTLLKTYPALSAALVNFGIFAAGYVGLKITAEQLVIFVGALDILFGALVHSNVVPLAKLDPPKVAIIHVPTEPAPPIPIGPVSDSPSIVQITTKESK